MKTPLHVYVGFDAIDHLAYRVCEQSILDHASVPVKVHALRDWRLRQLGLFTRPHLVAANGQKIDCVDGQAHSTEFSYTRFLTPHLHWRHFGETSCVFMDADMMLRTDIAQLFELADDRFAVQVVKHRHEPPEDDKIVGVVQQQYSRKNWSSVMLFPRPTMNTIRPQDVNTRHRNWLHQFEWAADHEIGDLPEAWNWLDGWSSSDIKPKIVHHTRGTPDMPDYGDKVAYKEEWWTWARKAGWHGEDIL